MNPTCPQCGKFVEDAGTGPCPCPSCGGGLLPETEYLPSTPAPRAVPRASAAAMATIGGYQLLRRLGQGGMGAVWEAEHLETGRRVALKLLSPKLAPTEDTIQRFLREARLAASLSHPRSTFVFGAGEHNRQPFIVMELMPGRTLQDVVHEEGPIPVQRAVDYALDVIEGLEAAHALGVIHRDVKPSNCFLDSDGRVKVGDFGLSKSLKTDAQLTTTGAFLGTPMFAAPEQLRGGEVDKRTDIYGVGATLYYLLARRSPFTGDAVAMIAQIASAPPTPLRQVCPKAPQALEQILSRALEKNPERRYEELAQLREALLPFGTGGTSIADVWRRLAAYMLDMMSIAVVGAATSMFFQAALQAATFWHGGPDAAVGTATMSRNQAISQLLMFLLQIAYFAVAEWRWGCGLGKWLMGLRVVGSEGQRPALWRSFLRAWLIPGALGAGLLSPLYVLFFSSGTAVPGPQVFSRDMLVATVLGAAYHGVVLLCIITMRARNGYRGIHEFASGTRVVRLKRAATGAAWNDVPVMAAVALAEEGKSFGPFRAQGRFGTIEGKGVVLAHDELLDRSVWILESRDGGGLSAERRRVARPMRPRWLQGNLQEGVAWEAVEAICGAPLPEWLACAGRLEWTRARGVLRDLADELAAGAQDGSLPPQLSLDQVWIDRTGRVRLLEAPLVSDGGAAKFVGFIFGGDGSIMCAVRLLRSAVERCCDQQSLPVHAQSLIQELGRRPDEAETLVWAARELDAMMERPARLDWAYRMATLAVALGTEFMAYMLACMLVPMALWGVHRFDIVAWVALSVVLSLALPAVIGFAFRGSPVFRFMQVEVRRRDGGPASRLRCALRSFLSYAGGLYFYSLLGAFYATMVVNAVSGAASMEDRLATIMGANPGRTALSLASLCSAEILLVLSLAAAIYAVVRPERGLQDLLAGTRLVPK